MSMVLARLLSSRDMGTYFLVISFIAIIKSVFSLGLPVTIVRRIAQYAGTGQFVLVKKIMVLCLSITFGLGALSYIFVVFLGGWLAEHLFGTLALAALMPQIGFLAFVALLRGIVSEIFRGFHELRFAVLFGGLLTSFLTAAALTLLWIFQGSSNISQVMQVTMTSASLVLIIAIVFFIKKLRAIEYNQTENASISNAFKELLSVSWAMWLIGILLLILSNADLWIVSIFGSENDVALYGLAARLTVIMTVFHSISIAVIQPIISELHAKGNMAKLEKVLRSVTTLTFVAALFITVIIIFTASNFLSIVYGQYYIHAGHVLIILAVGRLIGMFFGPIGMIQMMTGLQSYFLFISIGTGLVSVIAAVSLMPVYGIVGVAYAWLIGGFIHSAVNGWLIWKKLHIKSYVSLKIMCELFTKRGLLYEVYLMRGRCCHDS